MDLETQCPRHSTRLVQAVRYGKYCRVPQGATCVLLQPLRAARLSATSVGLPCLTIANDFTPIIGGLHLWDGGLAPTRMSAVHAQGFGRQVPGFTGN